MIDAEFEALSQEVENAKKAFQEKGKEVLMKFFKQVFEKYPDIESFGWAQYTPWFNDGDTCKFYTRIYGGEGVYIDSETYDDAYYDEDGNRKSDEEIEAFDEMTSWIGENLEKIDDDIYLALFGDHVLVTVHRDGRIEENEYSHD